MPTLTKLKMNPVKILSLPSRHPYTSKFNRGNISFVNPDTDLFNEGRCAPELLEIEYPPQNYQIVHVHFSFDLLLVKELEKLLKYFKSKKKPVVWTIHSIKPQRIHNLAVGQHHKILFKYADKIISPTVGAKLWVEQNWGKHKKNIDVIPLGFMADPKEVKNLESSVSKDGKRFTYLIGEFRENKEFIQSIINFLQCSELNNTRLQLIFKPINMYGDSDYSKLDSDLLTFYQIIQHPRVEIISKPQISNTEIIRAFLRSHAIILPYKWGTHSGQVELARDCGCHVVVSDVGFYKEQWSEIVMYKVSDKKYKEIPKRYTDALIEAYGKESLKPAGGLRKAELEEAAKRHLEIYKSLIR